MAVVVQVDGLSGTGKSTLRTELARRGHDAVDADAQFAYFGDPATGLPTEVRTRKNWIWDLTRLRTFCEQRREGPVFICGGAMNQAKCSDLFTTRIMLCIDDATMQHRLLTRTSNAYGRVANELAEQLKLNRSAESAARCAGWVVVDATKPIADVTDDVTRLGLRIQ